ncbi:MAG: hypothetical protein U0132_06225 [Gemmatimonadaceae bacterium]
MPDAPVDVRDVMLQLTWMGEDYAGRGRLRLFEHELVVDVTGAARVIRIAYAALSGADLRSGALTLYAPHGQLVALAAPGIEGAWLAVQERACALPELTIGLRALGSRHGGDAALQGRFFAPLLAARRRLEEQRDLEWRLVAFDAEDLRQLTTTVLRDMVAERTFDTAALRRSLEAQALDEAEGLHAALESLGVAAEDVRRAADAERFEAWRAWASRARVVFVEADRCWLAVRPLLERLPPSPAKKRRGRKGPGGGAALALLVGVAMVAHA